MKIDNLNKMQQNHLLKFYTHLNQPRLCPSTRTMEIDIRNFDMSKKMQGANISKNRRY